MKPSDNNPWQFKAVDAAFLLADLAGAVAGAVLWKQHRVLGFLAGGSAVGGAISLVRGRVGSAALTMVPTAAGVAASLYWPKHPALGFILGHVGGSAVTVPTVFATDDNFKKQLASLKGA